MGEGWGWLKTSEYRHMKGGGLKVLKNRHMIFEGSLYKNTWHSKSNDIKN